MLKIEPISEVFSQAASHPLMAGQKYVREALSNAFREDSEDAAMHVCSMLTAMGLPLPAQGSIMTGSEGALIFLNDYGITLRIEKTDDQLIRGDRVNDHPMVLQPLGSRQISNNVMIEVCPGCKLAQDKSGLKALVESLPATGINLWDRQVGNTGLMPFKTAAFPDGIPVVIDRIAVEKLSDDVLPVKDILAMLNLELNPQEIYQPLQDAFDVSWPEGQVLPCIEGFMKFLQKCVEYKNRGYLEAGWLDAPVEGSKIKPYEDAKRNMAADAGKAYAHQIAMRHIGR